MVQAAWIILEEGTFLGWNSRLKKNGGVVSKTPVVITGEGQDLVAVMRAVLNIGMMSEALWPGTSRRQLNRSVTEG